MLTAFLAPLLSMMSEVPGRQGNAVSSNGVSSDAPSFPDLSRRSNDNVSGNDGVGDDAPPNPQPSPRPTSQTIDDATFYVMNPNDPEGSRVVGLQLREAAHRAKQVDSLQSQLHQRENENATLQQQLAQVKAQLQEMNTQRIVAEQLSRSPVSPQQPSAANAQAQTQAPQQGVPPQGTQQSDSLADGGDWDIGGGTQGVYGYQEPPSGQLQGPQAPAQQPLAQTQNVATSDPQSLASQLIPIFRQIVREEVGDVKGLVQQETQSGFQQLQQERSLQDRIANTFNAARDTRAEDLRKLNVADDRIRNILDLEDMSAVLNREAEMLAGQPGDNIATVQAKIRDAATLQSQAATERANAIVSYQQIEKQRQFETEFETDPYKALDIEEPDANYDLTNPNEIEKANQRSLQAAIQMAEGRERVDASVGGI